MADHRHGYGKANGGRMILGIDPGTNFTGYGLIEVSGSTPRCLVMGYIDISKVGDTYEKLRQIFTRLCDIIDEYKPTEAAFESPFFGENVQSMLKLGRAQGVAMTAALSRGLEIHEYAPRRIKQTITGNGAASKEQVASLLCRMLKVEYEVRKLDATDGLAVALCHYYESNSIGSRLGMEKKKALGGGFKTAGGKSTSWEKFIAENPDRECKNGLK